MTARMVRLTQPEPYRATGVNTLRTSVVTVTLRPKVARPRLSRKVAA